jgi:N-acetyltransferase
MECGCFAMVSYLNKNCKYLLLQFAFENMEFERVEFRADARNNRSIAAMKRIGCIEEGIIRSHADCIDGTRRNSIVLSILKAEWKDNVKENLLKKCAALVYNKA